MRTILVTPDVKLLAEIYSRQLTIPTGGLSKSPKDSLKELYSHLCSNRTKIAIPDKLTIGGLTKKHFKAKELPQYAQYINEIINRWPDINKLTPNAFPKLIEEMNSICPAEYLCVLVKIGRKTHCFYEWIVDAMDYDGVRENVFKQYVKDLNIKTCVYCNAQYATTVETEPAVTRRTLARRGKIPGRPPKLRPATLRATYELDHHYPKSLYPYLCTNFYNLYPCCGSCNKHKSDSEIKGYSLYSMSHSEKPLFFAIRPQDLVRYQQFRACSKMKVELHDNSDGSLAKIFNQKFAIDLIYEDMSDEVRWLLWRHACYKQYGSILRNQFPRLFKDGFDFDQFVLGTYSKESEAFLRPLTIMKQDIWNQLNNRRQGLIDNIE